MYYFGCIEIPGHYLSCDWFPMLAIRIRETDWPFGEYGWKLDGNFAPPGPQIQSAAKLTNIVTHTEDWWTVLGMWDRTVDNRAHSNSNFIERGKWTFDQMVEIAKRKFPAIWERINKAAVVTLVE